MKKILKYCLGFIILICIIAILIFLALVPTFLINPETQITKTLCLFSFWTLLLLEVIGFLFILSKYKR